MMKLPKIDDQEAAQLYAEAVIISLLDDDVAAAQFESDLYAEYCGDPVIYAIQELSRQLVSIASSIVSAYIFFRAVEKRHSKAADRELAEKIEALLSEHHALLRSKLESVNETLTRFEKRYGEADAEINELRRIVTAYQRTTHTLMNPTENMERLKQVLRAELMRSRMKQAETIFKLRWPFRK